MTRAPGFTSTALGVLMLSGGCASTPDPPPPVVVEGAPEIGSRVSPPGAAVIVRPVPAGHELPAPPPVEMPVSIDWTPGEPLQASALAVSMRAPGGESGASATVSIGTRSFRLSRAGGRWVGVAALPLEASGWIELVFRIPAEEGELEEVRLVRVRSRAYDSQLLSVAGRGEDRPETVERIRREREEIGSALSGFTAAWLAGEAFEWPRPHAVTSTFGQKRVFNGEVRSRHLGVDLRGGRGDPIGAPADGIVALTGDFFYQGNAVYIDHGLGVFSGLFHMSRIDVRPGDRVNRGQIVGRVGSTGRSTAPHLHWSAYAGGENVDPASLLRLRPTGATTGAADPPSRDDSERLRRSE